MSSFRLLPLARTASLVCVATLLFTGAAIAQSNAPQDSSAALAPASSEIQSAAENRNFAAGDWSSSLAPYEIAEFRAPEASAALPAAPSPSASSAGQADQNGGGMWRRAASGLAFEAGFGFNAPESNSIGWGWNLLVGAGVHAGPNLTVPIEYQFIRTGLAQYIINEAGSNSGYTHIWSFGLDPIFDIAPKASNDFYIKGGGGFYRKVTSFTNPQQGTYCDYFYGYCYGVTQNVVVGHFSSNQGGWNIGGGYYHRFGGIYGTSKMKFFAEARYLDVLTPAVKGVDQNGNPVIAVPADTKLIPVTFGFSW